MNVWIVVIIVAGALFLLTAAMAVRVVKQYELGVLFRSVECWVCVNPACASSSRLSMCYTGFRCGS